MGLCFGFLCYFVLLFCFKPLLFPRREVKIPAYFSNKWHVVSLGTFC